MDNNDIINQANSIITDYINRTKHIKKDTVFRNNTVLRILFTFAITLCFAMSAIYFVLWLKE